ncbi:ABC transporter ATP-binding protein [Natronococcus sp. A-GB7]|uniref:ABC transporter ATP-binding protein n=1 Tax=Natronococcus sp. A-GB7 TaxID=3037649 RepID=UPI00242042DF|nr:ABC transporter ATP-binding protein [Natronococcus sp. A-GB7]MDG5820233.1 ABC transporter ATP-binding protein [Natronococcus sp. A-GB7]
MTLLELDDLKTYYRTEDGWVQAADGINLELDENETLGLVGESGSGKTTVAKSLIKLLPDNAEIVDGEIRYKGADLTDLSMREIRNRIRWKEISMVPQNAMNGFDPVYTVGNQIVEAIQVHEPETSDAEAWGRARDLFDELGLDEDRVDDYPHQFSGGMAQRAMIALALAVKPSLILADEPTTALDVVIQDRILRTIEELQDEFDTAMIMITHDMSVVSESCDTIAVMYGGRLVEYADADTIIKNPRHPYTLGLRNAFPDITADDQELISIPGTPPDVVDPDEGCRFAPRCPFAEEECWEETPEPREFDDGHIVECHRADEAPLLREEAARKETWQQVAETEEPAQSPAGGASDD